MPLVKEGVGMATCCLERVSSDRFAVTKVKIVSLVSGPPFLGVGKEEMNSAVA